MIVRINIREVCTVKCESLSFILLGTVLSPKESWVYSKSFHTFFSHLHVILEIKNEEIGWLHMIFFLLSYCIGLCLLIIYNFYLKKLCLKNRGSKKNKSFVISPFRENYFTYCCTCFQFLLWCTFIDLIELK